MMLNGQLLRTVNHFVSCRVAVSLSRLYFCDAFMDTKDST